MLPGTLAGLPYPLKQQLLITADRVLSARDLNSLIAVDSTAGPVVITLPPASVIGAGGFFQVLALTADVNPVTVALSPGDNYNQGLVAPLVLNTTDSQINVLGTATPRWFITGTGAAQSSSLLQRTLAQLQAMGTEDGISDDMPAYVIDYGVIGHAVTVNPTTSVWECWESREQALAFTDTQGGLRFFPFVGDVELGTGSWLTAGSVLDILALDTWIQRLVVQSVANTPGATDVGIYVDGNLVPVETDSQNMNVANGVFTFEFNTILRISGGSPSQFYALGITSAGARTVIRATLSTRVNVLSGPPLP